MRGKTARALRNTKVVLEAGGASNVEYDIKQHYTRRFDKNTIDNKELTPIVTNVATLKPDCGRKAYKTMKKLYKELKRAPHRTVLV